ncbi:hypothetical protein [Hymenobacter negativus]|uniref:DUF1566 domain-containing protein n=1 Tax=Hymenobacter negativus TaxID=2795026 RepID=A0ABS3QJ53_9BACT|nr:hypothetical protein [Hymenobacter negativus]MBO2011018.1 hypothetical protein [Hymenobacter negativus]
MPKNRLASFEEFAQVIAQLPGHSAWRSEAGPSTGSIFTFQFGLPSDDDDQEGEFSLMVYCAWRIVEAGRIVCSWHEDSKTVLAPALQQLLLSGEVTDASLSPFGDFTIQFANDRSLQIWNDAPFEEGSECWSVGYQGRGYYAVESRNRFVYEEKE